MSVKEPELVEIFVYWLIVGSHIALDEAYNLIRLTCSVVINRKVESDEQSTLIPFFKEPIGHIRTHPIPTKAFDDYYPTLA